MTGGRKECGSYSTEGWYTSPTWDLYFRNVCNPVITTLIAKVAAACIIVYKFVANSFHAYILTRASGYPL
jgi:hypothetical protein